MFIVNVWESLVCDIVFQSFWGFDCSPRSCLLQRPGGTFHGFWFTQRGFWYCFCCCVRVLMGLLFARRIDFCVFGGTWRRGGVNCRIHCGSVDCCLRLNNRWWWCGRFHLDSVPSDRGAMRGTNSIGPSVVFLYDFHIDPWFAAMAGWWLGIRLTANFDWFVLHTGWLVVVCFAVMAFLKDVFLYDAKVNHGRCQEMISGRQYGASASYGTYAEQASMCALEVGCFCREEEQCESHRHFLAWTLQL